MEHKTNQELKKYKEDFDFIHKKIGELVWKKATMFFGKRDLARYEIESIEQQLENYNKHMNFLLDDIEEYVVSYNDSKFNIDE